MVAAVSEHNDAQTIKSSNSCPPWFVLRNDSAGRECSPCVCKEDFGDLVICDEKLQESYLLLGNCMTYNSSSSDEKESNAILFGGCSYVYYTNIVNHRYINLPHNILDLNDIFCAPLDRHGLLCRDCNGGFGPSVFATGFAVQTAQASTMVGCYTSYQNLFLQLSFTLLFSHFESTSHLHQ